MTHPTETDAACTCPHTPPEMWLSAAWCGYGSGYEPGSMQEWDPDCPVHPDVDHCEHDVPDYLTCGDCAARVIPPASTDRPSAKEQP